MTRESVLKEMLEMQVHNLNCYKGKSEFEVQYQESKEKIKIIENMIDELPHDLRNEEKGTFGVCKIYRGWVEFASRKTANGFTYVDEVLFVINIGKNRFLGNQARIKLNIVFQLGIEWFINGTYDKQNMERRAAGRTDECVITVDSNNVITDIVWSE